VILVDSSIWIGHFRARNLELQRIIEDDRLLCHEAVTAELALGSLRDRANVIAFLAAQRQAPIATHQEILTMIEGYRLFNMGIGYTDAQLLASVLLDKRSSLWTGDKCLQAAAEKAGAALHRPSHLSN
jgi:predicted nucleic acid-binding protein